MVIKIKEITISRSRKFAWNYGNGVGYNVSITIEGTTAKDTIEDMRKEAITALMPLETEEQTRCKDVMDIAELKNGIEFKQDFDGSINITKEPAVRKPEPQFKEETIVIQTKGKGKYEWFPLLEGGKVRRCESKGCTYYLRWNDDIKKYQHGKYDANTKVWSYTHDICDYWEGGGS